MKYLILIILLISCNSQKVDSPKVEVLTSCPKIKLDNTRISKRYNDCCDKKLGSACYLVGMNLDKTYLGKRGNLEFLPFYRRACLLEATVQHCTKALNQFKDTKYNIEWIERTCKAKVVRGRPEKGHNKIIQKVFCGVFGNFTGDEKLYMKNYNFLKKNYDRSSREAKALFSEALIELFLMVEKYDEVTELLKLKFMGAKDPIGAFNRWSEYDGYYRKKFQRSPQYQKLRNFLKK